MDINFIDYEALKHVVDRIKVLINKKADIGHKHLSKDITTDSQNQFMNEEEKLKVSKLHIDGLGNKILLDNGLYKQLVDDSSTSNETTFSSTKIINELKGKSDVIHTHSELHEHSNKTVLDTITDQSITDWNAKATTEYVDTQFNGITGLAPETLNSLDKLANAIGNDPEFVDTITTGINSKVDKVEGMGLSTNDYTNEDKLKLSGVDTNANNYLHPSTHEADIILETATKRFVSDTEKNTWNNKVDMVVGKSLSTNDYTNDDKSKVAIIETTGNGLSVLANDGTYKPISNIGDGSSSGSGSGTSTITQSVINGNIINNGEEMVVYDDSEVQADITNLKEISNPLMSSQISQESPIGTFISYIGINTPEHYLKCDGAIYNISDYVVFANWIKEEFGSINFWGGDGVTTFAVPFLGSEVNITPTMTSNKAPVPYVVTASSEYNSALGAWKVFDNSTYSGWQTASTSTGWITLDFGSEVEVYKVKMVSRDFTEWLTSVPKKFIVQGSFDGVLFTDIKQFDNQTDWFVGRYREFTFDAPVSYRYFKINVIENNGGSRVSIGEINFIAREGENTFIKVNPTHYAVNQYGGFQMDTLWEGSTSTVDSFLSLEYPIDDYDYLIISRYFNGGSGTRYELGDLVITKDKYGEVIYDPITLTLATGTVNGVSLSYSITKSKLTILSNTVYGWQGMFIDKVIGVKGSIPSLIQGGVF